MVIKIKKPNWSYSLSKKKHHGLSAFAVIPLIRYRKIWRPRKCWKPNYLTRLSHRVANFGMRLVGKRVNKETTRSLNHFGGCQWSAWSDRFVFCCSFQFEFGWKLMSLKAWLQTRKNGFVNKESSARGKGTRKINNNTWAGMKMEARDENNSCVGQFYCLPKKLIRSCRILVGADLIRGWSNIASCSKNKNSSHFVIKKKLSNKMYKFKWCQGDVMSERILIGMWGNVWVDNTLEF